MRSAFGVVPLDRTPRAVTHFSKFRLFCLYSASTWTDGGGSVHEDRHLGRLPTGNNQPDRASQAVALGALEVGAKIALSDT